MKDYSNYSLLAHNTFGVDARCRRFLEYETVEEAQCVADLLRRSGEDLLIIGAGSNLLLTKNFEGIVVHSAIKGVCVTNEDEQQVDVKCGSGETWDDVVEWAVTKHLYGAENLSLIPGEVGASAVQNIGAYGTEVCQLITEVEAVEIATGKQCTFSVQECCYGYRDSRFKHDWKDCYLMTHVTYRLKKDGQLNVAYGNVRAELERRKEEYPTLAALRQTIINIRKEKLPDPKEEGNAGSFFMNPIVARSKYSELAAQYAGMPHYTIDAEHEKIPAGWLIEQCGWKGQSMGRAGVHSKQALVLVNRGGATGEDIVALCRAIQRDVKEKFDIEINPEVNIR